MIVPHTGFGVLFGLMAKYSRRFCLVDDGMDSFRDVPRNLSQFAITRAKKFYTFSYSLGLAEWTGVLDKVEVCSSILLCKDAKDGLELSSQTVLVVESPGLIIANIATEEMLLFSHPSRFKSASVDPSIKFVSGMTYSLEKTLVNFKGPVHIGETLVLIFILEHRRPLDGVHIHLTTELYNNLSCLHSKIRNCNLILT